MTTLAIMQPYFAPYLGYFRLFSAADYFVVYDCVQFPRRGWVHRNRLVDRTGNLQWLTLPLAKAAQSVRIHELCFRAAANPYFSAELRRFPAFDSPPALASDLMNATADVAGPVVDYLIRGLGHAANLLGVRFRTVRSSELEIDPALTGQQRIIAICQALNATRYVNSPGGRQLYDPEAFSTAGIKLSFLSPYQGNHASVLERLLTEPVEQLRQELTVNLQLED